MTETMTSEKPTDGTEALDGEGAGADAGLPDASVLEDKTPPWIRTTPASLGVTLLCGVVFVIFSARPLWPSDLWDHVNYGREIVAAGAVPETEPLIQTAAGVRFVDTAWLSQLGLYQLHETVGLPGIQFAAAACIFASMLLVAGLTGRRSRSLAAACAAAFLLLGLNWQQFITIRPQLIGVALYTLLFVLLSVRMHREASAWILFPAVFVLWANLHGSFGMGLILLAAFAVGRGVDVFRIRRNLRSVFGDPYFLRSVLLLQLCSVAVLINPYGLEIYAAVLRVSSHSNVATMFEWDPLTIRSSQGKWFFASVILFIAALRLSPRRLRGAEMILLIVTGLLTLWSARMINWWAPVASVVIGIHLTAGWRGPMKAYRRPENARGLWTVIHVMVLGIFFTTTNLGVQLVHGRTPERSRMLASETPVDAAAFLQRWETRPSGLSFVPAEWVGFLMHDGATDLNPMVNLHVHVMPKLVWDHYYRISAGASDWEALADSYGINVLVLSKKQNERLIGRVAKADQWQGVYEDAQCYVLRRRTPVDNGHFRRLTEPTASLPK